MEKRTETEIELCLRQVSKDRFFLWHMDGNCAFVSVDLCGLPSLRITTTGSYRGSRRPLHEGRFWKGKVTESR
eukprot:4072303-Amphidinium_carterae.1